MTINLKLFCCFLTFQKKIAMSELNKRFYSNLKHAKESYYNEYVNTDNCKLPVCS